MTTIKDFENAPVGATATRDGGYRAMKIDYVEERWLVQSGLYLSNEEMVLYTLDPSAPTTAREALDMGWDLAHEVKEGQVIPEGTRYLMLSGDGLMEFAAHTDFDISPGSVPIRTLEPLPEPEPDWLDAPAVIAATSTWPYRNVWIPESGGVWKCSCCRDEIHWYELVDVTPLWPKWDAAYSSHYDEPWCTWLGGEPHDINEK